VRSPPMSPARSSGRTSGPIDDPGFHGPCPLVVSKTERAAMAFALLHAEGPHEVLYRRNVPIAAVLRPINGNGSFLHVHADGFLLKGLPHLLTYLPMPLNLAVGCAASFETHVLPRTPVATPDGGPERACSNGLRGRRGGLEPFRCRGVTLCRDAVDDAVFCESQLSESGLRVTAEFIHG